MRRSIIAVLILFSALRANAAVIHLKDGGRLEGTVLRQSGGELVLQTAQGVVRIPDDKIQSIEDSPPSRPVPAAAPRFAPSRQPDEVLFGPQRQMISFNAGLAAPLSSINFSAIGGGSANNGAVGPLFGLQYLNSLSRQFAVGGEFQYAYRPWTYSPGLTPNAGSNVSGETALFLGELKYSLTDHGRARPFVLVGAGPGWNSLMVNAQPYPGFVWSDTGTGEPRRLINGSAWALAGTARLGVDFGLPWSNIFTLEAGWTGLTSANYAATPQGQALGLSGVSAPLNDFTLAGRVGWRF